MAAITETIDEFVGKISKDQVLAQARRPLSALKVGIRAAKLSKNAKPWVLFDLDETLTFARDIKSEALPFAYARGETPKIRDWGPWQRQLKHDVADPEMAAIFKSYRGTHNVGILTARSERARPLTQRWLKQNNLSPDLLMMRPLDRTMENMSSGPYKTRMIDRLIPNARIEHFYDDSQSVIDAMEARGIPATSVTPKKMSAFGSRAEFFHGTKTPWTGGVRVGSQAYGRAYQGPGFYTTTQPMAGWYARGQRIAERTFKSAAKDSPTIYGFRWAGDRSPNILNATRPLSEAPSHIRDLIMGTRKAALNNPAMGIDELIDETDPIQSWIHSIGTHSMAHGEALNRNLRELGYDAISAQEGSYLNFESPTSRGLAAFQEKFKGRISKKQFRENSYPIMNWLSSENLEKVSERPLAPQINQRIEKISTARKQLMAQEATGGFIDDPSRTNPMLGRRRSSHRGVR